MPLGQVQIDPGVLYMRSQIGDCSSCPSRPFWKEICPEAEQIIGQSTIPQNPNEHLPPKPLPQVDNLTHLNRTRPKGRHIMPITVQPQFITRIRPTPSPYKKQLRRLGISAGAVAQFVGLTYPYILNQLNGAHPMTERTETKIRELIEQVRSEAP